MSLRDIEHTFLDEVKNLATRHEAFYEKGLQDLDRVVSEFKSWRSKQNVKDFYGLDPKFVHTFNSDKLQSSIFTEMTGRHDYLVYLYSDYCAKCILEAETWSFMA